MGYFCTSSPFYYSDSVNHTCLGQTAGMGPYTLLYRRGKKKKGKKKKRD